MCLINVILISRSLYDLTTWKLHSSTKVIYGYGVSNQGKRVFQSTEDKAKRGADFKGLKYCCSYSVYLLSYLFSVYLLNLPLWWELNLPYVVANTPFWGIITWFFLATFIESCTPLEHILEPTLVDIPPKNLRWLGVWNIIFTFTQKVHEMYYVVIYRLRKLGKRYKM